MELPPACILPKHFTNDTSLIFAYVKSYLSNVLLKNLGICGLRITEVDQFVQQLIADHKVVSDTLLFDLKLMESKEMQPYEK